MTIPASLLIIIVPLVAALPAYILRRWRTIEVVLALAACGLCIAVLSQPAGSSLSIAGLTVSSGAPLNLLGRILDIRATERVPLMLLFGVAAMLFALSWRVSQGWSFVPPGLGVLSLVSAGLMIRPFVFAALALEAAAALAAIMIQAERSGQGSIRGAAQYLIVSTLALPAFLGAGYAVTQAGSVADPALQAAAYQPAIILLVIGFGLLFGALPLYTWTHSTARLAPPLATAFLATVGGGAVTFLFLTFKQEFAWFRTSQDLSTAIHFLGVVTLLFGAALGWAQRSFGRVIACGLSVEIGVLLLLLNTNTPIAVEAATFDLVARALSLGLVGLGVALLRQHARPNTDGDADGDADGDEFDEVRGLGYKQPWAAVAIALGGMSLAGIPGTIGFVARWSTVRVLGQSDLEVLVLMLVAGGSVGVGVVRGLMALFAQTPAVRAEAPDPQEARFSRRFMRFGAILTIVLVAIALVWLGLAPGAVSPITRTIADAYSFYR